MKRLFLMSAALLTAGVLVLSACGKEPDNDPVCTEMAEKEGASCKLYSTDQVCCDETTCTLTHEGKEYVCKNPDAAICADEWLNQICPTASKAERAEFAALLCAKTQMLMGEVRRTSLFCH